MSKRSPPGDWKEVLGQLGRKIKASDRPAAAPARSEFADSKHRKLVTPPSAPIKTNDGAVAGVSPWATSRPKTVEPDTKRKVIVSSAPPKLKPIEPIFPEPQPASNPLRAKYPTSVSRNPGVEALALVRREVGLEALADDPESDAHGVGPTHELVARIIMGAQILAERPDPDEAGFIVGFDFGTSCTKIVVHQPSAGDPSYALPVPPHLRALEQGVPQEHLWRSVVWFDLQSRRFSLEPTVGALRLEGFKTGLIQSDGHRMAVEGVTHAQAVVGYLALLIDYTLGFHRTSAPAGFNRNAHYSRFHFGVPVACKDEDRTISGFSRVLTAAFGLAPFAPDLALSDIRDGLIAAKPVDKPDATTPFLLFEELAGVIAGYRASPDARRGPHVVVDVGAATLDVATFSIVDHDVETRVPVYMAAVGLLGAGALKVARRKGVPDKTFSLACNQHTRHVISHTFLSKNPSFFPMNGLPKPLLFVGGGRRTDVHEQLYHSYPAGLEAPLVTPLPGRNLQYDKDTDFARLLLAWGLAQDELALPVITPPSEIEDYVARYSDYAQRFVDKDMC